MSIEEIKNIYDYSKNKSDIINKLNINIHQNGINIDKDILKYFSLIGITKREDITKLKINQHLLEIQKRDYELNPKYCLYCGNQLPFEKRFSKCCNQSCANSYSNIKRGKRSDETKEKISKSILNKIKIKNKDNYKLISSLIDEHIIDNPYNSQYIDKYINIKNLHKHICVICNKEFNTRLNKNGNISKSSTCSDECRKTLTSLRSKESIQKIKNEGRFQGWKSRNITSYPENFWKTVLNNNNIQYQREYLFSYGNLKNRERYFLDFYIEINGRKIDLEIDGKQHKFEDRLSHDIQRDKIIKSKGIEVYRIEWNEINSEVGKQKMKEKINNFLKYYNKGVV